MIASKKRRTYAEAACQTQIYPLLAPVIRGTSTDWRRFSEVLNVVDVIADDAAPNEPSDRKWRSAGISRLRPQSHL